MDLGNWSSERYVISSPAFDEAMLESLERHIARAGEEVDK